MKTIDLNALDLFEAWYAEDEEVRVRAAFPFTAATGNESTAMVYFDIAPGHRLGTHTDSAEEIVYVMEGTVEASLGDQTGELRAGEAVLIPALVPHGIRNTGDTLARCIGFFSASVVESVFDQPVMPIGVQTVRNVVESAV